MSPEGELAAARSGIGSITERVPQARLITLLSDDGVPIEAGYLPPAPGARSELALVVAHGFSGHMHRPAVQRVAGLLTHYAGVVTFSFRGHGRSGGRSTVGDREVLDLLAAVRWARLLGHDRVATIGFSMGGSVVLRQAGLSAVSPFDTAGPPDAPGLVDDVSAWSAGGGAGDSRAEAAVCVRPQPTAAQVDAVVSVSAPARWYYRGTPPMRRVHWLITGPVGRSVLRFGLGTRIHPHEWDPVPLPPVEAVRDIAPTPLLVVHGDKDGYFPLDHPRSLAEAAGESCELWIEPGFGHAENAAPSELLHRIGGWLARNTPPR